MHFASPLASPYKPSVWFPSFECLDRVPQDLLLVVPTIFGTHRVVALCKRCVKVLPWRMQIALLFCTERPVTQIYIFPGEALRVHCQLGKDAINSSVTCIFISLSEPGTNNESSVMMAFSGHVRFGKSQRDRRVHLLNVRKKVRRCR